MSKPTNRDAQIAALDLSSIGMLVQMAGDMLTHHRDELSAPEMDGLGLALVWLAGETEKRCGIVSENLS